MARYWFVALAALGASLNAALAGEAAKLSRTIALSQADFKLTPAALAFSRSGELFAGYREKGPDKSSSAFWIRVFDATSGSPVRSARFQTSPVLLPNGANQFVLSPDDSLLIYAQFHQSVLIDSFDPHLLRELSTATNLPDEVAKHSPRVAGISPDGGSLVITSYQPSAKGALDVRLLNLEAHDLSRVVSDATVTIPYTESNYEVGGDGTMWIRRANTLERYEPAHNGPSLKISLPNRDDVRGVAFLKDRSLLLWSDQNAFGYIYHFQENSSVPDFSQRIGDCGVRNVVTTPDQLYGAAVCLSQNLGEWRFGSLASSTAVIFEVKTLKILGRVSLDKRLMPEVALWHGAGRISIAVQSSSNKVGVYEISDH